MSADLGLCVSDEARASLRKEYKRKMDEDTLRVKKERQTTKHNKATKLQSSSDKEDSPKTARLGRGRGGGGNLSDKVRVRVSVNLVLG